MLIALTWFKRVEILASLERICIHGTPLNPDVPAHVPGGSSSGSAVVVAAQLVDFSLGTDTVGCVRTPASFCGILGFRASHGLVSTVGLVANSQSLDAIGVICRESKS
ncbi:hypothetical protein IFM89_016211 [Coptis chinensis]|uniref:Amidase domain-containing protein n=1 Tax=Coptis chinensis TaxID=261450 RepID=A0A835LMD6_9MAGN|nr:hypothetical protein IFM89_016211 [Coptis chinensis]